ncbi:hypothetical protein Tco_0418010 [Tanacetum coccineum]
MLCAVPQCNVMCLSAGDNDEEIEESMDSDSVSEDAEDEGPIAEDEDPTAEDKGLTTGVEDLGDVYSTFEVGQGSGSAPESERPERVSAFRQPTLTTWTDPEDGMIYIDIPDYPPPAPPVQTPPSPEWTSGSLPISPSHSDVPSPISSPMIPLTVPSPVTYTAMKVRKDIGDLFTSRERLGDISPRGTVKSLEYEQKGPVTFGAYGGQFTLRLGQLDERTESLLYWQCLSMCRIEPDYGYSLLRGRLHYSWLRLLTGMREEGARGVCRVFEESMDSDSVSEDAEDEGPTAKDEDPTAEDEGLTARVEGPDMDDESYSLNDERMGTPT